MAEYEGMIKHFQDTRELSEMKILTELKSNSQRTTTTKNQIRDKTELAKIEQKETIQSTSQKAKMER